MKQFTFVFMLFNISDRNSDDNFFNGQLETQLLESQYNPNINILFISTTFFEVPATVLHTFGTRLFALKKADDSDRWEAAVVANFGNINIGNKDALSLIFTYIKSTYKSTSYIVYSNNHSNQFGAVSERLVATVKRNDSVRRGGLNDDLETKKAVFEAFHYSIEKKPRIDMLTYNEFSKAFVNGFIANMNEDCGDTEKVALLILVGCYGGCIDNVVNFSNSVALLCVSEGEIIFNYINLTRMIDQFSSDAHPTLVEKTSHMLKHIEADYPDPGNLTKNNVLLTEFNCFDLDTAKNEKFIKSLNFLILFILADHRLLKIVKDNSYELNMDVAFITKPGQTTSNLPKNSIDLFDFLDKISIGANKQLKLCVEGVRSALLDMRVGTANPSSKRAGLSVFIPRLENRFIDELDREQFEYMASAYSIYSNDANEFGSRTLWPELLQALQKIDAYSR